MAGCDMANEDRIDKTLGIHNIAEVPAGKLSDLGISSISAE
jgi:hypothetical protein